MSTRRTAARGFSLRGRSTVLVLAMALGASVVVTADRPAAPPAPPAALAEAPTSALAMTAAQRQGTRVEALDQRTEKRTVFAQPDGTFTADLHVTPQRVRRAGGWVAPDPTLEPAGDGIAPKGTVPELALSRGGTKTPLVRMARDGHEYALTWPGTLPEPRLDGATATYADVLPDVDLKITTTVTGYAQHIVVKTPQAAASPELQRIRFDLHTKDLLLKAHDDGRLTATNAAGETIFESASSWMWDSARRETDSPLAGRSPVGVEITEDSLTLVPDAAALADPDAVFPLVIDPSWHTPDKQSWTSVYDDGTAAMRNGTHWNGANSQAETAWWLSGMTTARSGKAYGQKLVVRSYFQFDTGFLAGRQLLSSKFITSVVYGPTACGTAAQQALYDAGQIYLDTNWHNQPAGAHLQNVSVPSVYSNCTGFQEVGFTEAWRGTNAGGVSTFFLTAADETSDNAWRKYHPDHTKLSVNYNHQPHNAYEVRTDRDMTPCHWCAGVTYLAGPEVTLSARLSDPDDSTLFPMWEVTRNGATVPYNGAANNSGAPFTSTLDLTGKHDQTVSWRVKANDGNWQSPDWVNGPSFKVDVRPPVNPPKVESPLYPEDNRWHGGAAVPGTFTFTAKDADVDHFAYGWDDATPDKIHPDKLGLDGKASIALTPPGDGPQDLHVRSVDRAGNRGPATVYHFYVRGSTGPLAQYAFDGDTEDSAFLGWRDGTAHGQPPYVPGALGSALQFDGSGDSVSAPNAVRTDASFSVSAWVRLEDDAHSGIVLSQETARGYPDMLLWYQVESGKWAFGMPQADLAGTDLVVSDKPAVVDSWTHLTGVFDASSRQLTLYVDGAHAETKTRIGTDWHGGGNLRVGHGPWGGANAQSPFRGSVDEVELYDRAVSGAEVRAGVREDNVQLGHWRFDELDPAVNEVSGGARVVLSPGASTTVTDTALKNGDKPAALYFDGSGEARTDGPVLRTDRDFTVAGWVKPDLATMPPGATYTVLSQDGTASSGFEVFLRGGKWHFGVRASDGSTAWNALAVTSQPAVGNWTHLTAVFDASTRKAELFVDGDHGVDGDGVAIGVGAPWDATGDLVFGRSHAGNHLKGHLDDWRAYSRVLAPEEIKGIVAQDGVTAGTWKLDTNADEASLPARNGTAEGDVAWTPGQSNLPNPDDHAVRLSGSGHVSAPRTIDTTRSFSVTAWAKVDRVGSAMSVVSLEGSPAAAFDLRTTDDGRWAFTMSDDATATRRHAYGGPAQVGVWTHLAAGYDQLTERMWLYVNGLPAATAPHLDAWSPDQAVGRLRIGGALVGGKPAQLFSGAIDDVSVYSRPLFADEIRRLAGRDLALVHEWQLDEPTGTSAADSVGARSATLTGGATHAPGRLGNALAFDGTGSATTQGVDLRTDESFTVSAWVRLPEKPTCEFTEDVSSCEWVALSVDGQNTSKFRLGHVINDDAHQEGKWFFEMPESDAVDAVVTKAAVTTRPSDINQWVHLTGVYDAKYKKVWIYVNGTRIGDGTLNTPWPATNALVIGRGKVGGGPAQHWTGSVDEVRVYTGPLTDDRVSTLHKSYPEENPTPTMPTPTGHWKFNENTGTSAADSVGGRTATLKNGAGWIAGRTGHAAWLDGVDDHAETAGPVLTTESPNGFTVAAWVYLHGTGTTGYRTVVAQDGNRVSTFRLGYDAASDRWTGVVPQDDRDDAATFVVRSTTPAAKSNWTHLALSYNARLGHLKLHVNGVPAGTVVGADVERSTGPLTVGRMKAAGGPTGYFPRGVDDVRVFDRALSDGELKLVQADVSAVSSGQWRFDDDTVRDYSQRNNPTTATGTVSFVDGVNGRALKLDGTSSVATKEWGASMRDSFTVSAWARLEARDEVATVVGQDGSAVSGFVLQYRPEADRWVFGGPTQDTEQAPLVWAMSTQPPKTHSWTHLTGVYDRPNGRLRLYVDGKLAGVQDGVALPEVLAPLTIGAGKVAGKPGDFFKGSIDEVRTEFGVQTEAVIAGRGGYATPAANQLGVLVNGSGDRATGSTTGPLREGYHLQSTLGTLVDPAHPNTRPLYSCLFYSDVFSSLSADCEGQTVLGVIGTVYRTPPSNVPTIPVYRCAAAGDHFESRRSDCAGAKAEGLLGHTVAYAALTRNFNRDLGEHTVTVEGMPAGYRSEGTLGFLSLVARTGTHQLMSCHDGGDQFVSTSATCDGKAVGGSLGWVWTQAPADVPTYPLHRCRTTAGQAFASLEPTCEGLTVDGLLGHVERSVPTTSPVFPA